MTLPEYRVLLLEDNEWDARMAREALALAVRAKIDVHAVSTLDEARNILAKTPFDAIITDLNLADSAGLATLDELRALVGPDVAIVVMTGAADAELVMETLEHGADEFVPKGILESAGGQVLPRAVRFAIQGRQAATRLRAQAEQHEAILQAIPEIVARVDAEGRYVWVNRAGERAIGRPLHELVGTFAVGVASAEETLAARTALKDSQNGKFGRARIFHLSDAEGRDRIYSFTGSPLVDRTGKANGSVGVGRDVTEDLRVAERDRALADARAEVARMQEAALEESRFFHVLSHELNSPMTVLLLQVEMLKEHMFGDLTPDQTQAIDVLDRTLDRMRDLMADLLDTARIRSGVLYLRKTRCDLRQLMTEAAESYAPIAAKAGLTLDVLAPADITIEADARRIQQMLVNYLVNAVKFTPAGGHLTLYAKQDGSDVVVCLKDTGRGLTPDQIAKLFQRFSQVHEDSARRGTGLGLYITKMLAEAHGGAVGVESEGQGKGSTFWLRIPLAPAVMTS